MTAGSPAHTKTPAAAAAAAAAAAYHSRTHQHAAGTHQHAAAVVFEIFPIPYNFE